ncbi:hypothetical protein QM063_05075 [Shewanella xiamenensis]|nr:hypothetical protein [Shewanella xiamenensis]MDV5246401.1 hypothetical protein [Shewanella xiamenensis]
MAVVKDIGPVAVSINAEGTVVAIGDIGLGNTASPLSTSVCLHGSNIGIASPSSVTVPLSP